MELVYITIVTVAVYSSLPLVSAECFDKAENCYLVKNYRGMCDKSDVKSNCPLSCGICGSSDECVDYADDCYQAIKIPGMCNDPIIKSQCLLSCGFCDSKDECVDKAENCHQAIKIPGICRSLTNMKSNCRLSC